MRCIIIIITILFPFIANCETYFRDGMKWVVQYVGDDRPEEIFTQNIISLEGDTILDGVKSTKMYIYTDNIDSTRKLISVIHEEDDKVWFRDFSTNYWYLMYDFSLKEGEGCEVYSITRKYNSIPYGSYLKCVQTQESSEHNGIALMSLEEYETKDCEFLYGKGVWIKDIGNINGVLENNGFELDGEDSKLLEASLDGNVIYKIGQSGINDAISSSLRVVFHEYGISIFNIAKPGKLTVHKDNGVLVGSYDVLGDSINIPLSERGIYIISIGNLSAKIRF